MNGYKRRGAILCLGLLGLAALGLAAAKTEAQQRASPLDFARATLQGHAIEIQYGRPSMRGRVIFGGLVPWGRVWRTGANEATHLRTPVDLRIAGTLLPAGEYTLYSVPAEEGWTLIINSQTGQWGTAYDQGQDFARVPMKSESLPDAVETLTITIDAGTDSDGVIRFDWEKTRATLAFDIAGDG